MAKVQLKREKQSWGK